VREQELAKYCHIEVSNVGAQSSTLVDMEATHRPRADGSEVFASTTAFQPLSGSKALPALLGPGEMWSARLDMRSLTPIAARGEPIIRVRATYCEKPIVTAITEANSK
jgi:hypothetical protein